MNKLRVLVIFGGESGEHDVSLVSAASVIDALDKDKYEISTVGITKNGRWYWGVDPRVWEQTKGKITAADIQVTLVTDPVNPHFISVTETALPADGRFDIIFPVLHGPKGEDGTIQGLFEIAGVPYVGSGVLGGALGMDKDRMKAVLVYAGLPIVPHITVFKNQIDNDLDSIIAVVESELTYPVFVKPANLGSSVGISKVNGSPDLGKALEFAAEYDYKVVIEQGVNAREIELAVLGNEEPTVTIPGEIIPSKDFYDYEAKYLDNDSKLIIPAKLNKETVTRLQEYAVTVFKAVDASGLGRVDFFVTDKEEIFVNEINTLPGFTSISMYPKLWEASGIAYSDLLDRLIQLGLQRYNRLK